jgi:hypothetical protein
MPDPDTLAATMCDLCGEPVPYVNDRLVLEFKLAPSLRALYARSRHLLPTDSCPGSPPFAQYLEGQPRADHDRPYDPTAEATIRTAYSEIQTMWRMLAN